jgi:hypothetical protein
MMRKGNIIEVRNSTVKVMLPSLGHALVAEVRKENIEKLVTAEQQRVRV